MKTNRLVESEQVDSGCVAYLYANGDLSVVKSYRNQGKNLSSINSLNHIKNVRDSVYLINSDTRPNRGQRGISPKERRRILDGCAILAENYNPSQLATVTLSLPSLNCDAMSEIHQHWSDLLRQTIQDIKRDLKKAGIEPAIVYRTEIQEERMIQHGELALHAHLVFPNRHPGKTWAITVDRLHRIWSRKLNNLLNDEVAIPTNCVTGMEMVRDIRKLASYLTKKNTEVLEQAKLMGYGNQLPKSWAGASARIRKQAKESKDVVHLDMSVAQARTILEESDHAKIGWAKKQTGSKNLVAVCGRVNESEKEKLVTELQQFGNYKCA